jgi:hypothetical protein
MMDFDKIERFEEIIKSTAHSIDELENGLRKEKLKLKVAENCLDCRLNGRDSGDFRLVNSMHLGDEIAYFKFEDARLALDCKNRIEILYGFAKSGCVLSSELFKYLDNSESGFGRVGMMGSLISEISNREISISRYLDLLNGKEPIIEIGDDKYFLPENNFAVDEYQYVRKERD